MAYPTLTRQPSTLDPDGELEDAVLRSPTDAGYVQTRPKYTRMRRVWGVRYPELPDVDVAALRTYESTTLVNGAASFTWTHPKLGTSHTVNISRIKYSTVAEKYGVADVSFTLTEV